jgi:hypothetical protein
MKMSGFSNIEMSALGYGGGNGSDRDDECRGAGLVGTIKGLSLRVTRCQFLATLHNYYSAHFPPRGRRFGASSLGIQRSAHWYTALERHDRVYGTSAPRVSIDVRFNTDRDGRKLVVQRGDDSGIGNFGRYARVFRSFGSRRWTSRTSAGMRKTQHVYADGHHRQSADWLTNGWSLSCFACLRDAVNRTAQQ